MQTVTDNRSRHRQVGSFRFMALMPPGQVVIRRQLKRRQVLAFFQKLPPCLTWHRGLRLVSLLVARTSGTWTYCAIDAASFT